MKRVSLLLLFIIPFILLSCDLILDQDLKDNQKYYVSIRIVDISTGTPMALSGHLVGMKLGDDNLPSGHTDSNGWFTSYWEFNRSDFVSFTIFNKSLSHSVTVEAVSPTNHPEMFVTSQNDFKTNIPPIGYHIYTTGLND